MNHKKNEPYYRRGKAYAANMARLASAIWYPAVRDKLPGTERVTVDELVRHVTLREAQCLELYYSQGKNFRQIGEALNINVSTISRNIQRGEQKINRVVDFANALLEQTRAEIYSGYQV